MNSTIVATREVTLTDLDDPDRLLVEAAQRAARNAYAPYSGFAVGVAVRTRKGNLYTGANMENAAYGVTMCGEAAGLTAANSAGDFDVEAMAVVGRKFIEPVGDDLVVSPCGRCRQLICEAGQISHTDVRLLCCNGDLSRIVVAKISELLPMAFGPANIGLDTIWPALQKQLHAVIDALAKTRGPAR